MPKKLMELVKALFSQKLKINKNYQQYLNILEQRQKCKKCLQYILVLFPMSKRSIWFSFLFNRKYLFLQFSSV